jgi:hypothetical protein
MTDKDIVRLRIDLSALPLVHWAKLAGMMPSNLANWLKGRATLSAGGVRSVLSVLSVDPETMNLLPGIHVWTADLAELAPVYEAIEKWLSPPVELALASPEHLAFGSQIALIRGSNDDLRIVLVRKTGGSSTGLPSTNPETVWITPKQLPSCRWKKSGPEDPPIIRLPDWVLLRFVSGNATPEFFDHIFDNIEPVGWETVRKVAEAHGLTARNVVDLIAADPKKKSS